MKLVLASGLLLLAGCGALLPAAECDTNPEFADAGLGCYQAVTAALMTLPPGHPAITRVQFLFGSATPFTRTLIQDPDPPVDAYVVFTFVEGDRQYVPLVWDDGQLSAGDPAPY